MAGYKKLSMHDETRGSRLGDRLGPLPSSETICASAKKSENAHALSLIRRVCRTVGGFVASLFSW